MSIQADILALTSIKTELSRLTMMRKKLKEKEGEVIKRISEYCKARNLPGVTHMGSEIRIENVETRQKKPARDAEQDAISILEANGVKNSEIVLTKLLEARKGDVIEKQKLKIKKIKEKRN